MQKAALSLLSELRGIRFSQSYAEFASIRVTRNSLLSELRGIRFSQSYAVFASLRATRYSLLSELRGIQSKYERWICLNNFYQYFDITFKMFGKSSLTLKFSLAAFPIFWPFDCLHFLVDEEINSIFYENHVQIQRMTGRFE